MILCIDSNQNVYTGSLARKLEAQPMGMFCAVKEVTGEEAPASWFRGSEPISTIYCSPGVVILNVKLSPFYWGLGDHHAHILEVTSESLFGGNYARVPQRSSRQLNCMIDRTRRQYVGRLGQLVKVHKMHAKLDNLFTAGLSVAELSREHEKFDSQMGELMAAAEASCTRYKSREIEFSPEVDILIKRKQVLAWMLRFLDGKVPHPARLERAAKLHCIEYPLEMTREEVEGGMQACREELREIQAQAPSLRERHLRRRLWAARDAEDEVEARELTRIIRREGERRRQNRINRVVRPPRGRAVQKVQLNDPKIVDKEDAIYKTTQDEIVSEVSKRLEVRFQLGKRAPASSGQLGRDLGEMADTEAGREILEGTYAFPEDCDAATRLLLE